MHSWEQPDQGEKGFKLEFVWDYPVCPNDFIGFRKKTKSLCFLSQEGNKIQEE